jgi:CheY-like chemotaxis protein
LWRAGCTTCRGHETQVRLTATFGVLSGAGRTPNVAVNEGSRYADRVNRARRAAVHHPEGDDRAMARRVLVVDDEPDILDLLTMLFEDDQRCSAVEGVGDLDDAVPKAVSLDADAIVLDLMFGHRTCVEILPALRAARPDAHIVVFTSSRRAATAAGVLDLGADVVVQKVSVSFDDLTDLVLNPPVALRTCDATGHWLRPLA